MTGFAPTRMGSLDGFVAGATGALVPNPGPHLAVAAVIILVNPPGAYVIASAIAPLASANALAGLGGAGGLFGPPGIAGAVSGSLHGAHQGDSFSANFSGALNGGGSFDVVASGVLQGNWGDHVTPYPLSGRVSGRVDRHAGSGRWSGKNQWGSDGGSWQASK